MTFPAILFEKVLKALLYHLQQQWTAPQKRPIPDSVNLALSRFEKVWIIDGSTAEWGGKVYIQIDRFFPSSKLHNKCLYRIDKLPLDVRFWDCPKCREKHIERDINAAQNIRDEALRLLALGRKATACGGTVSRGSGREKSTTEQVPAKQESQGAVS